MYVPLKTFLGQSSSLSFQLKTKAPDLRGLSFISCSISIVANGGKLLCHFGREYFCGGRYLVCAGYKF
jgi:hypothetical protein